MSAPSGLPGFWGALAILAGLFAVEVILYVLFHETFRDFGLGDVERLGLFSGWLFWRTASLWPCILAHVLFNSTAVLRHIASDGPDPLQPVQTRLADGTFASAASFVVSALGMHLLWRLLRAKP